MGVGFIIGSEHEVAQAAQANGARIYELRTYTTNDGKLDDLHARFANHTNQLFVRHNMTLIGYWTPSEGDTKGNTLTYLIGHESRDAAKKNWQGFINDANWKKAYADSRKDGALVKNIDNVFLDPTDYSPLR
ncbi:NIPSNAP family protein [bacterium AH-315-P07]|nr:NIPSNAP family protein [bacterium AH-315-P07]